MNETCGKERGFFELAAAVVDRLSGVIVVVMLEGVGNLFFDCVRMSIIVKRSMSSTICSSSLLSV